MIFLTSLALISPSQVLGMPPVLHIAQPLIRLLATWLPLILRVNSLAIPKRKYLAHIVEWAWTMGSFNNNKLIANYLDFFDVEAQVSPIHLSPNSLYYLPSLFHFLENKAKDSPDPSNDDHEILLKLINPSLLKSLLLLWVLIRKLMVVL